jgi:trimethylamine--corrinoid protein Co-methyltransferase
VIPRIQPADRSELELLHAATLEVLATTGVRYPDERALTILREAGAAVDESQQIARLPKGLVEEMVKAAPSEIVLAGRDSSGDVRLDGSHCHLTLDGTGTFTLDHISGERRASTMADLAQATLLADALPEVDIVWNIVNATDSTGAARVLEETVTMLQSTGKHIQGEVQRAAEVPYVMELLAAVSPGGVWDPQRPIFSAVYCPVPPLTHEPQTLAAGMALAEHGVPMNIYSMGLAGATAPLTLAGAVLQANAEILSAIVLFELIRPGLPLMYTADTGVLDMRAGTYAAAGPEAILLALTMTGMARFYELPVMGTGLTSDANQLSLMSGVDGGMACLSSMLTGPDLLVGAGMLAGAAMLSLPKILLDAEIFRQCRRVTEGLTTDETHLMTPVIDQVGPGGHFLKAKETRQFARDGEHYRPEFMVRESYDRWSEQRIDEVARATAAVERILATHQAPPLPPGAAVVIADVLRRANVELGQQ